MHKTLQMSLTAFSKCILQRLQLTSTTWKLWMAQWGRIMWLRQMLCAGHGLCHLRPLGQCSLGRLSIGEVPSSPVTSSELICQP